MSATPTLLLLTSDQHLEQQDLGDDFRDLLPMSLLEIDSIGFRPDPNNPMFELCQGGNLLPAVAPLLSRIAFSDSTRKVISLSPIKKEED